MTPPELLSQLPRRAFLRGSACGLGSIALASLLSESARGEPAAASVPAAKRPHFRPRAKSVIFLFMAGAPSQLDLFTPKPELTRLHGEPVPASLLKGLDDALIKGSARVMASPRKFAKF